METKHFTSPSGRIVALLALGLLGLTLHAGAGRSEAPPPARGPDEGEALFQRTCAPCHGRDARGLPGLGKDLVAGAFARRLSDAELIAFIERGRPHDDPANTTGVPMPPKGGNPALTRRDLADIVAYLRTLQR
jgi:disulfide bond formation protein DsbB